MKNTILKTLRLPTAIVLIALAVSTSSNAAMLAVSPTVDTLLRSGTTGADNGASAAILVGEVSTSDEMRGIFSFDLSSPLLVGATINSISLRLVGERLDGGSSGSMGNMTVGLHEVSSTFTSSANWNFRIPPTSPWVTAGGDFGSVLATVTDNSATFTAGTVHTYSSAALTTAGAANVGGTFSLLARNQAVDNTRSIFFYTSNEDGTEADRPSLVIDFTPVPEPSSAFLLGLGCLALILRRRK